jgi:glycosyltransferase involved in cell wall biosynthesis
MAMNPVPRRVLMLRANPIDPDPRLEKTARALTAAGARVTVLGRASANGETITEAREGWEIRRLRPVLKPHKGLWNFPGLFVWQVNTFFWMLRNGKKYAVLHACDFETIIPAVWAGRLLARRVVYEIYDLYADTLNRTPGWIVQMVRRIELGMIGKADAVILADDSRVDQIRGARPKRVTVINNTPEEFHPSGDTGLRPKTSRLHIVYVGALEWRRGLRELIEAVERHADWSLLLAGRGRDVDEIAAEAEGIDNVAFSGAVAYDRALALEAEGDVIPATYDPGVPNHRYASPNKLFEAMMLGKPIVCAAQTGMDGIVNSADCGIVIPYGNTEELERALQRLTDAALRERLGRNGQRLFKEKYAWPVMRTRLLALYKEIGVL